MTVSYSMIVKCAISVPDPTFARVDTAAARLGVTRSEFFARAAERWLDTLDDEATTQAIDRALDAAELENDFADAAAVALARSSEW